MADAQDRLRVAELLGREPMGDFEVVVRDDSGDPVVIRNAALLGDGTPMPTLFWLVDRGLHDAVSRLESAGAVREFERLVDAESIAATHHRYAAERDAALPVGHVGPKPSGGVGGTARGLKCLHAHYAYFLAGGDDPVGALVHARLHADMEQA